MNYHRTAIGLVATIVAIVASLTFYSESAAETKETVIQAHPNQGRVLAAGMIQTGQITDGGPDDTPLILSKFGEWSISHTESGGWGAVINLNTSRPIKHNPIIVATAVGGHLDRKSHVTSNVGQTRSFGLFAVQGNTAVKGNIYFVVYEGGKP